jgi:hypothetical protein
VAMPKLKTLRSLFAIFLFLSFGFAAVAAGPEEELGPEKMALADEIVEKVIYGIRYEKLRGERIRAVIKAWAENYGREGAINQRESMMIQVYAARAATLYNQGVEHVPYADRKKSRSND